MKKWQLHEVAYVEEHLSALTFSQLAQRLGRSRSSVSNLVSRLDDAKRSRPTGRIRDLDRRYCRWRLREAHLNSARSYCLKDTQFGSCYCPEHLRRLNLYSVHSASSRKSQEVR
jgi:hypothetical protein